MEHAYTVAGIRRAEAVAIERVGGDALMQRAAAGVAAACGRELRRVRGGVYGARVLLLAGPGNNGGDGLFAAASLAGRGAWARAWRTSGRAHPEGWAAFLAAGGREVDAATALAELKRADLVLDAVVGIGGDRPLGGEVAGFARRCADLVGQNPGDGVGATARATPERAVTGRSHRRPLVVAVDLPSGLGAEAPFRPQGCLPADVTVTFGGLKPCHVAEPARGCCGRIDLVDLGLDLAAPCLDVLREQDVARLWPRPDASSDKYSRGVVGLDVGSSDYPGAAVLSAAGAIGAGAGMVRYFGAREGGSRILDRFPSVVLGQGRVQALVVGSGWGEHKDRGLVARAVASGVPLVVDADGLRDLPATGLHPGVVLTPHAGELAGLLRIERSVVAADPCSAVEQARDRWGATVLLKGATQYVASPGQVTLVAVGGPAWTAQAGSGDVLAGACGTLLAAGVEPRLAAGMAASLQALAAREYPGPFTPDRLAARFAQVIAGFAR